MSNRIIIGMIFGALGGLGFALKFPPDDVLRGVLWGAFSTMFGALVAARSSEGGAQ